VFVGRAVEYEISETLVSHAPGGGLREASPGHRPGAGDDAGFQRPAADLTAAACKQPGPGPGLGPSSCPRKYRDRSPKQKWSGTRPAQPPDGE